MARNTSPINSGLFSHTIGEHGLAYNTKNCWESLEDHYICLDKFNDVYGKNFDTFFSFSRPAFSDFRV